MPQTPSPGYWTMVDPQNIPPSGAPQTVVPQYVQIQRVKSVEDTTPTTTGIVLDQKVFFALVIMLGIVVGVILMMLLDKYSRPMQHDPRQIRLDTVM